MTGVVATSSRTPRVGSGPNAFDRQSAVALRGALRTDPLTAHTRASPSPSPPDVASPLGALRQRERLRELHRAAYAPVCCKTLIVWSERRQEYGVEVQARIEIGRIPGKVPPDWSLGYCILASSPELVEEGHAISRPYINLVPQVREHQKQNSHQNYKKLK